MKGLDKLLPGITGWAQVNGRDELSIEDKVALDEEYMNHQRLLFFTSNGSGINGHAEYT